MGKENIYPLYKEVEITDLGTEGKALARRDGLVIFVKDAVPGDIMDVQVRKKRKNYLEGYPVKYYKYSPKRSEPFCEHFRVCGGCKLQHIKYEEQLYYKQKQVSDNLERIAKVDPGYISGVNTIIPSPDKKYYRNKLEFTFSNRRWFTREDLNSEKTTDNNMEGLGFHIPGYFDKVVDIKFCYLQRDPSNNIRLAVKEYALKNKLSFFDHKKKEGFLRSLIIRISNTNEIMVVFSFFYEDLLKQEKLMNYITSRFPEITSLMYVINSKANDTISDLEILTFSGKDYIIEKMEELNFRIGPKTFYQTNSGQAQKLYNIIKGFSGLSGKEIVYDLYSGAGTIANYLAGDSLKVIGIENISEAVENARINSKINSIKNTVFYTGDVKDIFTRGLINKEGYPDLIILDPPRAGLHKKVIQEIINIKADRIVYVSCNPATQARDIHFLNEIYKPVRIQALDMFPYTHHVENVVLLEKQ